MGWAENGQQVLVGENNVNGVWGKVFEVSFLKMAQKGNRSLDMVGKGV